MFEHETGNRSESRYEKEHTAYVMSYGAEFRGRREGRVENGVKNLMGNESILKTFSLFFLTFLFDFNVIYPSKKEAV
jgi:hypothetical protein